MPKLWNETIAGHRREVSDAILDAAAQLVAREGLLAVTMSQIAVEAGIGRATLYKYFPDVEAVLLAWHQREVSAHLDQLHQVKDRPGSPIERLAAVLERFALITHHARRHHDTELAGVLHRHQQVTEAEQHLREMLRELIAESAGSGEVRKDVAADELAGYCLHALAAAGGLPTEDAVRRLVNVTLTGMRESP